MIGWKLKIHDKHTLKLLAVIQYIQYHRNCGRKISTSTGKVQFDKVLFQIFFNLQNRLTLIAIIIKSTVNS